MVNGYATLRAQRFGTPRAFASQTSLDGAGSTAAAAAPNAPGRASCIHDEFFRATKIELQYAPNYNPQTVRHSKGSRTTMSYYQHPLDATSLSSWKALEEHRLAMQHFSMREAFKADPTRFDDLSVSCCGLFLD